MVDAIGDFRTGLPMIVDAAGSAAATGIAVSSGPAALARYAAFADRCAFSPPGSPRWVTAWVERHGADFVLAEWREGGDTRMALPLEIVRDKGVRIAQFPGGKHANGNFPAVWPASATALADAEAMRNLSLALRTTRPDIDLILLERMLRDHEGIANPLLGRHGRESPNVALAVDLSGGFEAVLERTSAKRKRKKHRSQTRKYEAAGGFRRIRAETPDEVDRLLGAFFEMKSVRFQAMGVRDVFADAAVRGFFRDLFIGSLGKVRPEFVLHALEVGGKLRAVTGSSRTPSRLICEFGTIAEDELAGTSPGDFLFFENIREACEEGLSVYDFSVGDEAYKRLWCGLEACHVDVVVATSMLGRVFAAIIALRSRAVRTLKRNAGLFAIVKRLRTGSRSTEPPAPSDD